MYKFHTEPSFLDKFRICMKKCVNGCVTLLIMGGEEMSLCSRLIARFMSTSLEFLRRNGLNIGFKW